MRIVLALCLIVGFLGCSKQLPSGYSVSGKPIGHWLTALSSKDVATREKAVQALGNVGPADPAAIPALIDALRDDDSRVRGKAALALLKSGADAEIAVPALTVAAEDQDTTVRKYAAKALEVIQGRSG